MTIREILARRDAIRTELRVILDKFPDGNLPDPDRRRAAELETEAGRLNDAELVTAAANVEKNMDAFRNAYDSALAANTNLTPASRQSAIHNVDAMKNSARALHAALGKQQKGITEANALLKESAGMVDATLKLPPNSSAMAAWAPVREELSKVALAYEVTPSR